MKKTNYNINRADASTLMEIIGDVYDIAVLCNVELCDYIEKGTTISQRLKLEKFVDAWKRLTDIIKELAQTKQSIEDKQLIVPPVPVDCPFKSDVFTEAWKGWKDYLIEQHGIVLFSRVERMQLYVLNKYSDNNEDRAIQIINLCIARLYKTIYNFTDNDLKGKSKPNTIEDGEY